MKKAIIILAMIVMSVSVYAGGYKPGDKAKDFKLKNVDGKMVSMADYPNAKGFIVIFSCNHCPFVKMTEGRIIGLDKKFTPMGYPVIAINSNDAVKQPDESYAEMQKNAKEKGFGFPYLVDETQEIARAYGATNTPHVFVIKKDKKEGYVVKYVGGIDDNTRDEANVKQKFVEEAVSALESGKNPDPAITKAIGCAIKWKGE